MLILCTKGCGVAIDVTQEAIEEANKHGVPIAAAHEVCPRDREQQNEYRVQIVVSKREWDEGDDPKYGKWGDWQELARNGASVEAETFADAYAHLSAQLGTQWEKVGQMRYVVESTESRG